MFLTKIIQSKTGSIIAGIFAIIIWGVTPALVKVQATELSPTYFLFLRYLISTVLFSPILLKISWRQLGSHIGSLVQLAFALVLHLAFQVLALKELPLTQYVILFSLAPLISFLLLGQKISKMIILSFVLATLGSWLFVEGGSTHQIPNWNGIVFILISLVSWGLFTRILKTVQSQLRDIETTAICNFISFIVFTIIWIATGGKHSQLSYQTFGFLVAIAISIPIAFFLFAHSLRQTPVVAIFAQYLEPVIGVICGVIFFNENLSGNQILGTIIILSASFYIMKNESKNKDDNHKSGNNESENKRLDYTDLENEKLEISVNA